MEKFFNRATASGGRTNKTYIKAKQVGTRKSIKKLALGLTDDIHKKAGRRELQDLLLENRKDGIFTPDEIKADLQTLVNDKQLKTRSARKLAIKFGLRGKKMIRFHGPGSHAQVADKPKNVFQPVQDKNKIKTGSLVSQNIKSTSEKIEAANVSVSSRISMPVMPENFLKNSRFVDEVTQKDEADMSKNKRTIWDVMAENKRNNE